VKPIDSSGSDGLLSEFESVLQRSGGADPLDALAEIVTNPSLPRRVGTLLNLQGTRIGDVRLVRLVGLGGMGATYEALDKDGARVALKLVGAVSEAQLERFQAECDALAKLSHPNIAGYRGSGVLDDGRAYLVMDFVEGENLEDLLDDVASVDPQSPLSGQLTREISGPRESIHESPRWRRRILRMLAKVAEALHAAHQSGIVHRDVKPGNIMVGAELEPVLVDFGLARDLFRGVSLTRSAAVMGTVAYMAPEQLGHHDSRVGPRTDVFALGLVLYRALVGEDLRMDPADVLLAGNRKLVIDSKVHQALPKDLLGILYGALDHRPTARYRDARALADDLRAASESGEVSARSPGLLRLLLRRRAGKVAVLALLVVASALTAWALWPHEPYYVRFDAIHDVGTLTLDGDRKFGTPTGLIELEPGEHRFALSNHDFVDIERTFVVGERQVTAINLRTISENSESRPRIRGAAPGRSAAQSPALLSVEIAPDVARRPGFKLTIDGAEHEVTGDWIGLAPGLHDITCQTTDGLMERQRITLQPNEAQSIQLLARPLLSVEGSFRLTWQHAEAPLPRGLSLHLDDGVVRFMNDAKDSQAAKHELGLRTCIAPLVADRWLTATLEVAFPEPMYAVAFWLQSEIKYDLADLEIWYQVDDADWLRERLNDREDENTQIFKRTVDVQLGSRGTRTLRVRARMRTDRVPSTWSALEHLTGFSNSGDYRAPAFAVVGDPTPR